MFLEITPLQPVHTHSLPQIFSFHVSYAFWCGLFFLVRPLFGGRPFASRKLFFALFWGVFANAFGSFVSCFLRFSCFSCLNHIIAEAPKFTPNTFANLCGRCRNLLSIDHFVHFLNCFAGFVQDAIVKHHHFCTALGN